MRKIKKGEKKPRAARIEKITSCIASAEAEKTEKRGVLPYGIPKDPQEVLNDLRVDINLESLDACSCFDFSR